MKQRLVHFRTKPRQEDKPSVIRRVAQVAVPLAAVGGVYAYMHHYSRPRRAPIPDNNPGGKYDASRKLAAHGGTPIVSAKVNAVLASATKNIGGSMTADDLAGTVPFAPKASTPAPVTPAAPAPVAPTPAAPTSRPATNPPGHRAIIVDKPQASKTPGKKPKVLDRRDPKVKAMLKKHNGWTKDPKTLAAHIRQVAFNRQDWTNGNRMGTPDGVMTAVRKGQRIVPWVNRSGEVAGDLGDMASGKQVKDPFFKKTWFKRAMQGAAIAAPILASRKLSKYHRQAEEAKSGLGSPLSGYRLKALTLAKEWLPDTVYKHAVERPMFDTKVKNLILLHAVEEHLTQFGQQEGGLSLGTAKKVLRDLRGQAPDTDTVRPRIRGKGIGDSFYSPPKSSGILEQARQVAIKGRGFTPSDVSYNSVVIPRGPGKAKTKMSPVEVAIHETGHAATYSPPGSLDAVSYALGEESKANRAAYNSILKHGTAAEAAGWKKAANAQLRVGYRKPYAKLLAPIIHVEALKGAFADRPRATWKKVLSNPMRLFKPGHDSLKGMLRQFPSLQMRNVGLAARLGLTQFDYTADQRGWDLRDARGRSARVYAPGSRRRERREKEWGEKTDNIRMVRNAAILAAAAGLGGTVYYRSQAKKLTQTPKLGPEVKPGQVLTPMAKFDPSLLKNASARVRLTRFSRSDRRPTLDRVLAAANEHALDPAVDALVPTVPDSVKSGASRVADDMARGVLENAGYGAFRTLKRGAIAGTLLGGGALLGHLKRKPRLGLAGGALAAGMYLGKSS